MSRRAPTALGRLVDRELRSGLGRERRRGLVERLRGNPRERRDWDRAMAAFRVLEDAPVARVELDQVERWLFEDLAADGVLTPDSELSSSSSSSSSLVAKRARRWTPWIAGLASLGVAVAVLAMVVTEDDGALGGDARSLAALVGEGELQARGATNWPRPLAIEVLCGEPPRAAGGARGDGCELDELLGFSARLEGDAELGREAPHLSLFALDGDGELLYYAPTPAPAPALRLGREPRWQALPMSVRLDVNHEPGALRVFAIASAEAPSVDDVQRWAEALQDDAPAGVDDPPWHLRLSESELGLETCPKFRRCASAETELTLGPAR